MKFLMLVSKEDNKFRGFARGATETEVRAKAKRYDKYKILGDLVCVYNNRRENDNSRIFK